MTFQLLFLFFFNDTATTEIYTLSLHDALPISDMARHVSIHFFPLAELVFRGPLEECIVPERFGHLLGWRQRNTDVAVRDRKSTRLNSSHANISYAVFCLKKKKRNRLLHGKYTL